MGLNKKYKCWYRWLSIIGFGILYKYLMIDVYYKKKDFDLYLRLLGKMFYLLIFIIVLPTSVLLMINEIISKYFLIIQFLVLCYVYISGVVSTDKLYEWAEKNI